MTADIPEVEPYYRARVTINSDGSLYPSTGQRYVFDVVRGDTATYGPVDGLTIGWKLPGNAAYPAQPEIPYATFQVIVPTAADFAGVDVGSPVSIHVWSLPEGAPLPAGWLDGSGVGLPLPVATFGGRITELKAEPHRLGMVYTLSCLDYLVDLSDTQVSDDNDSGWPGESLENRLTRLYQLADDAGDLFAAAPWAADMGPEPGWGVLWGNAEPPLAPVADHMTNYLSQYVHYGHYSPPIQGGARGILMANTLLTGIYGYGWIGSPAVLGGHVDNQPDPLRRYDIRWQYRRMGGNPSQGGYGLPANFGQGGDGMWRPIVDPASPEEYGVLPARYVDFDPTSWSRTKKEQADKVRVQTSVNYTDLTPARTWVVQSKWNAYGVPVTNKPAKVITVETELGYASEARTLGRWLIPDPAESELGTRWEVDAFRLRADQVPGRLLAANRRSWFAMSSVFANPLVAIGGLDPARTADGRDYYVGLITGATFTIKDGRYSVDFQLSRQIPKPVSGTVADTGRITVGNMKAVPAQAAVKLNQLDPTFTVYDYRIVRGG